MSAKEALRFEFLLNSRKLSEREKKMYEQLVKVGNDNHAIFSMSDSILSDSLQTLSMLLYKHYERKVIILIDEYDVPLKQAFQAGYFEDMTILIQSMFGNALKSNTYLQFAVLMGCQSSSAERIFYRFTHMKIHTVTDIEFGEFFGFTDADVRDLLSRYHQEEYFSVMKQWYAGYQFGKEALFCPWDVINFCEALLMDARKEPQNCRQNYKEDQLLWQLICHTDRQTKDDLERLISGESVMKAFPTKILCDAKTHRTDGLWFQLLESGYLTAHSRTSEHYCVSIPNEMIRNLFLTSIREWVREMAEDDPSKVHQFCKAFSEADCAKIEDMLNGYLWNAILLLRDAALDDTDKNTYFVLLLGLLCQESQWLIQTEAEEEYCKIWNCIL